MADAKSGWREVDPWAHSTHCLTFSRCTSLLTYLPSPFLECSLGLGLLSYSVFIPSAGLSDKVGLKKYLLNQHFPRTPLCLSKKFILSVNWNKFYTFYVHNDHHASPLPMWVGFIPVVSPLWYMMVMVSSSKEQLSPARDLSTAKSHSSPKSGTFV